MERNSCDTAFRCLEVAVHPNTGDREALAAVAGYRRIAGGASLAELCLQFARDAGGVAMPAEWAGTIARLQRETLSLLRELGRAKAGEAAALRRADTAERRLHDFDAELRAARERADVAERRLAEATLTHDEIANGLRHAIFGLRSALSRAHHHDSRGLSEPPSFGELLTAARDGSEPPGSAARRAPAENLWTPSRSPWTA